MPWQVLRIWVGTEHRSVASLCCYVDCICKRYSVNVSGPMLELIVNVMLGRRCTMYCVSVYWSFKLLTLNATDVGGVIGAIPFRLYPPRVTGTSTGPANRCSTGWCGTPRTRLCGAPCGRQTSSSICWD